MGRTGLARVALLALLAASCQDGGDRERPAPTASPAGRLAVAHDDDVYVVNADGTGRRALVRAPGPQLDPDWSPDGASLAYRDSRAGINVDDEIHVAAVDGSGVRNLTENPAND